MGIAFLKFPFCYYIIICSNFESYFVKCLLLVPAAPSPTVGSNDQVGLHANYIKEVQFFTLIYTFFYTYLHHEKPTKSNGSMLVKWLKSVQRERGCNNSLSNDCEFERGSEDVILC